MAEYIEREALIEKCKAIIQDKWNDKAAPVSWSHAYADFIEDIENQPAADVAPVVHARWEMKSEDTTPGIYHVKKAFCSNCGKPNKQYRPPYCPHCGATMDKEERT